MDAGQSNSWETTLLDVTRDYGVQWRFVGGSCREWGQWWVPVMRREMWPQEGVGLPGHFCWETSHPPGKVSAAASALSPSLDLSNALTGYHLFTYLCLHPTVRAFLSHVAFIYADEETLEGRVFMILVYSVQTTSVPQSTCTFLNVSIADTM